MLQYAGNDNEVAAVIANELGHIICCHADKSKLINLVLNGNNTSSDSSDSATTSVGEDFLSLKLSQKENSKPK